MNYIVYKTTNIINGHIYIGVHYEDLDNPSSYIGCGVTKKDKKKSVKIGFPAAVRKYGHENFKRETLFVYPDSEEGMNDAYAKEAELVNEEFVARDDTYNLIVGGKHPPHDRLKKAIAQYDLNGTFIRSWNSITEAETKLQISNIYGCLSGRYRHSGGFQWKYYTDESDITSAKVKEKTVYQFDLSGNLIKVWKSTADASKLFENKESAKTSIYKVCKNKRTQYGGFYWSFKCVFEFNPDSFKKTKPVARYDDFGNFIESYTSVAEAARVNNISSGNIIGVIKGKHKRCGGYRWRYFYGNTTSINPIR